MYSYQLYQLHTLEFPTSARILYWGLYLWKFWKLEISIPWSSKLLLYFFTFLFLSRLIIRGWYSIRPTEISVFNLTVSRFSHKECTGISVPWRVFGKKPLLISKNNLRIFQRHFHKGKYFGQNSLHSFFFIRNSL